MAARLDKRITLTSSRRSIPRDAKAIGKVNPEQRIEVTLLLRPHDAALKGNARANALLAMSAGTTDGNNYLTRETFGSAQGAALDDIQSIERFAHDHDLTVTYSSVAQRMVKVTGTLSALTAAFGAKLKNYRAGKNKFRGRTGELSAPQSIADSIVGVYGFDTRPAASPRYRAIGAAAGGQAPKGKLKKSKRGTSKKKSAAKAQDSLKSFTAVQVAELYNFPEKLDGSGQCIAIIELNTTDNAGNAIGTGFSLPDLKTYFAQMKIPMPAITAIGIAGGANIPNTDPNSDVEVMLDIQVVGAVAPGARLAVYFAPNTSKGFIEALSAAVHDKVRKPSVISISWGGPEDPAFTSEQQLNGLEQILQDAAQLGITVCCASGDSGSEDIDKYVSPGQPPRDGAPHVDFPASSPFALACGGTTLAAQGNSIQREVVWNEGDPTSPTDRKPNGSGGGGVSNILPLPAYQKSVSVPKSPSGFVGRGSPDVAGNADSVTGYLIKLNGYPQLEPVGGTSAVAPLWAGLIALINQRLSSLKKPVAGLVQPKLYNAPAAFHDIRTGNNDISGKLHKYSASIGWDPCTGLGSPNGTKIMQALGG
jgi:kumamolisin